VRPGRRELLLSLAIAVLTGCGSLTTLTVRPTQAAEPTLVPAPRLSERKYKRLLIVPPEEGISVSERVESPAPSEKDVRFYTGEVEKILLAKGFEVVSSEIVARARTAAQTGKYSFAERALVMGRGTQADAVMSLQKLTVEEGEKFYHIVDKREVAPAERVQDDDGRYYHRETKKCLYRLPFFKVSVAAKLIDVQGGDVLWVGEGVETSLDTLPKSWVAQVDSDCQVREQVPFNYHEYFTSQETYERVVKDLLMRLFEPLRVRALAPQAALVPLPAASAPAASAPAASAPAAAPAAVAAPAAISISQPQTSRAVPGKIPTATISSGRAILRDLPQHDGLRINLVPRRTRVEVLQSSGEWHKIKLEDGTVGWMHDDSLLLDP
jgi:hypothetical protein